MEKEDAVYRGIEGRRYSAGTIESFGNKLMSEWAFVYKMFYQYWGYSLQAKSKLC